MRQTFVLVFLTVSMFVGSVCPVSQKEEHDSNTVPATLSVTANSNNPIPVPSKGDNKKIEPLAKPVEDAKATVKVNNSDSASTNATNTNATTANVTNTSATTPSVIVPPINKKHNNCNSTKEQEDMLNCYVTSHDSGEDTEDEASTNTAVTVTVNKPEVNNTESQESKNVSSKTKEKDKSKDTDVHLVLLKHTEHYETSYEVVTTEQTNSINTTDADTDSKLGANRTEGSISSVAPLLPDNAASTGSKDVVQELKSTDQRQKKGMPSGMIALVTAISFAIAIAAVYIGMIVWRRYIEYRYGHRELLVNELEFDTNDLRHFEL